jgi:DNA-binding NtrC family response regulator
MTETRALLVVGSEAEDRRILEQAANRLGWDMMAAGTIREAIQLLGSSVVPVIVCQNDLPDGTWRDVLNLSASWQPPAKVIVVSRLADIPLWSVVLNLGCYDLLASPLDEREVLHVLGSVRLSSHGGEPCLQEASLAVPCL